MHAEQSFLGLAGTLARVEAVFRIYGLPTSFDFVVSSRDRHLCLLCFHPRHTLLHHSRPDKRTRYG